MLPFASAMMMCGTAETAPTPLYWRMLCASSGQPWVKFADLQFRATIGGADLVPVCTAYDMSPSGIVIQSSNQGTGQEGWRAFDGDASGASAWTSAFGDSSSAFVGFRFPSPVSIAQVQYTTGAGSNFGGPTSWQLQTSSDGTSWSTVTSRSGLTPAAETTYAFSVP